MKTISIILNLVGLIFTACVVIAVAIYLIMVAWRGTAWENLVIWLVIGGAVMIAWSFGWLREDK